MSNGTSTDLKARLAALTPEELQKLSPAELAAIEEFLEEDQTERLRGSFLDFCQAADPKFQLYPHVRFIGEYLQAMYDGEIDRLMIMVGPRHSKSYTASLLFPAYCLYNKPDEFVMLAGCTADLARNKLSVELREFMRQPPISMEMGASSSKEMWRTNQGGGVIAAGVGGTIIGLGTHTLVIDDAFKSYTDAMSPAVQNNVYEWYTSVATNRLEPGGKILIINQRFGDNDLSGRVLHQNPDDWTVIRLPAIAEEDDPMGRKPGEALCPDRYDIEALERKRRELGPTMFESVYQQNPIPEEGSLFKRADAKYFTKPDKDTISLQGASYALGDCPQYLSCDLAQSEKKNADYSVITHNLVTPHGDLVTLNIVKGHWKATETERQILDYMSRHTHCQFVVIERSAGSLPIIDKIKEHHLVYDPPPRAHKTVRAVPLQILQERGKFWTPRPEDERWVTDLEHELYRFPLGRNDDQVDALAWAAEYVGKGKTGNPEFIKIEATLPPVTERVHKDPTPPHLNREKRIEQLNSYLR